MHVHEKIVKNIQMCNLVTKSFLKFHSLAITTIKSLVTVSAKDFIKITH